MKKYYRVYPTKRVKGFTHTYMEYDGTSKATLDAITEAKKMERYSGVEWKVELVER